PLFILRSDYILSKHELIFTPLNRVNRKNEVALVIKSRRSHVHPYFMQRTSPTEFMESKYATSDTLIRLIEPKCRFGSDVTSAPCNCAHNLVIDILNSMNRK